MAANSQEDGALPILLICSTCSTPIARLLDMWGHLSGPLRDGVIELGYFYRIYSSNVRTADECWLNPLCIVHHIRCLGCDKFLGLRIRYTTFGIPRERFLLVLIMP